MTETDYKQDFLRAKDFDGTSLADLTPKVQRGYGMGLWKREWGM